MPSLLATLLVLLVQVPQGSETGTVGDTEPAPAPTAQATTRAERSLETLETLQATKAAKDAALKTVRDGIVAAEDSGDDTTALVEEARTLQAELAQIKSDYAAIATSIDIKEFEAGTPESFDLRGELQELIQPIVEELKAVTEAPRQIERLRAQVAYFEGRSNVAAKALENIEVLLATLGPEDPSGLRPGLEEARKSWQGRLQDINGQKAVAYFQLDKRLSERSSILESTQSAFANFFRTRGLNLALGLLTFFAVLTLLRSLYGRVARKLRRKDGKERPFYARLIDVLYFAFVGTAALVASLLVLYASGDWVLLGVALLFLLGLAWASKAAVPLFLEQIRLLLNLGAVRERERVLFEGVPYRVSKLSFYTLLSNTELAGGVRRLPIRDLIDMRSRIASKDEIWFPCRRGDWVLLADGTRGLVVHQSPDTVQLETLGGSTVTYPCTQFLGLSPKNLSCGFRLLVRFGIDYAHQAISTTVVPQILRTDTRAALESEFGEDALVALRVDFLEAGASSLDYALIADMTGSAAQHYDRIQRVIQRQCVDTCNREGWVIPFTQVTLHQALPAEVGPVE